MKLYDLPRNALAATLAEWGYSNYHASRLWEYLYRDKVDSIEVMTGLRPDLQATLKGKATLERPEVRLSLSSEDGLTDKFLLGLSDGQAIETVLMRYPGRATACVSTQVGCALGCVFCATGQMGFIRHLSPGEIVTQIMYVAKIIGREGTDLRNVVFMGMGEPLHNYDAVMAAVDILTDDAGLAMGPRHITLSTVGLPPAIRRLADEGRQVNLAVSLHAANDEERSRLVPLNRRWPLSELVAACRYYAEMRGRRIFFEWALIAGENDGAGQAQAVGRLLQGLDAHVNLIPLNPTSGYSGLPSDADRIRRFQTILADYGLPSTVRQRRGIDIGAGCGQLRS